MKNLTIDLNLTERKKKERAQVVFIYHTHSAGKLSYSEKYPLAM